MASPAKVRYYSAKVYIQQHGPAVAERCGTKRSPHRRYSPSSMSNPVAKRCVIRRTDASSSTTRSFSSRLDRQALSLPWGVSGHKVIQDRRCARTCISHLLSADKPTGFSTGGIDAGLAQLPSSRIQAARGRTRQIGAYPARRNRLKKVLASRLTWFSARLNWFDLRYILTRLLEFSISGQKLAGHRLCLPYPPGYAFALTSRAQNKADDLPRKSPQLRLLSEVHETVDTGHASAWRRMLAFAGPAYLVSVGYMDPGNWATDLQGGAQFGYRLLWVLVLSNAMAVLLQTLGARLGIVSGRDLAQACRESYPRRVTVSLWILCEIAIAACDLAEVLGAAIALNLLFHHSADHRRRRLTALDTLLSFSGLQKLRHPLFRSFHPQPDCRHRHLLRRRTVHRQTGCSRSPGGHRSKDRQPQPLCRHRHAGSHR